MSGDTVVSIEGEILGKPRDEEDSPRRCGRQYDLLHNDIFLLLSIVHLDHCKIFSRCTGNGQYRQNKGDLPPHRSPKKRPKCCLSRRSESKRATMQGIYSEDRRQKNQRATCHRIGARFVCIDHLGHPETFPRNYPKIHLILLGLLSGKEHQVYTGVTLIWIDGEGKQEEYSFSKHTPESPPWSCGTSKPRCRHRMSTPPKSTLPQDIVIELSKEKARDVWGKIGSGPLTPDPTPSSPGRASPSEVPPHCCIRL